MSLGAHRYAAVGGKELFGFYYPGDDLGAVYTPNATAFRVFAPTALRVSVVVYPSAQASQGREIPMYSDSNGTWHAEVSGDLNGKCYTYRVTCGSESREAADPYAIALTVNGKRSVVVDLSATNPEGWEYDTRPPLESPTDAVIYEMHVRDFSISSESGIPFGGKYVAIAEKGTSAVGESTGLDHLVELGVTHVHLMPVQDFASVDETDPTAYNWGYDPYHFFVPEGSYSLAPNQPGSRITEFKKMVQALHKAGLRVIIDVVYNHTFSVGDNPLNVMAPGYYYRTCRQGKLTNGSGCGNEIATERPMARKLILDSLRHWVTEYHVDGFRFDLMALIDEYTVAQMRSELRAIEPSLLLYGEPWTGGPSGLDPALMFTRGKQRGTGIAVFNDVFRNAIKGDNDGDVRGFVQGGQALERAIATGVVGSIAFGNELSGQSDSPEESVNYVSCHDNLTLWDKMGRCCPSDSRSDRIRMVLLAQAIVLTSQGVAFIEGGSEMLRTKYGNSNSYGAGDAVNAFDWHRKADNRQVFDYMRGLISMRRAHPAFRMREVADVRDAIRFLSVSSGVVAYHIDGTVSDDEWESIVVVYNARRHGIRVDLPVAADWKLAVAGLKAGNQPLDPTPFQIPGQEGKAVFVPALSAMVIHC